MQAAVRHMPSLDLLSRLLPVKYLTCLSSSTATNANAASAHLTTRTIDNDSKNKRLTDRTGLRYHLHWKRKLLFCFVLICFIILNWVWSGLIASPLDKNAQFAHYIALMRLLCLHGGKERQKFVCPLYIVLEILEHIWVIL